MGIFGNMFSDSSAPLGSRKNPTNEQKKIRNLQAMAAGSDNEAVAAALDDALNPSTSSNTGGGYTSFADMFDRGGPGKSGAVFGSGGGAASDTNNDGYVSKAEAAANPLQQNLISSASNYVAGGGMLGALARGLGGGGSTAPRKRYGTKGITSAQRSALEAKDYTVSPSGVVMSPSGSQVAGANFSGSRVVNSIMNDGELSGESLSFGDAFAAAREKQGGDGGTFTYGGEKFTTNIGVAPKTSLRPKLRSVVAPTYDYDAIQAANIPVGGPLSTIPAYTPAVVSDPYISNVLANQEFGTYGDLQDQQRMSANRQLQSDSNFIDTEDDDLFTPIGARESLGERYKRQRLGDQSGIATLPGSYESVGLGNTAFGRFLNDNVLGDRTQLATGSVGRQDGPEFLRPENLNVTSSPPDNSQFNYNQKMLEAGVDPVTLQPTRAGPMAPYVDEYEYDLLDDRLEFNEAAIKGGLQTGSLALEAARLAATKNLPTGLEAMAGGLMPEDRFSDVNLNAPLAYGPQYQDTAVAELAGQAKAIVDQQIDRVQSNMNEPTRAALSREIMKDFDVSSFDPEAFAVQAAQVIGGIGPVIAAGVANPFAGMAIGGAATAGDVSQVVDQAIRKRAEKGGDLYGMNPRSLDGIIQVAQRRALAPSAALGAAGASLLTKTGLPSKLAGIITETIAESVIEPNLGRNIGVLSSDPFVPDSQVVSSNPSVNFKGPNVSTDYTKGQRIGSAFVPPTMDALLLGSIGGLAGAGAGSASDINTSLVADSNAAANVLGNAPSAGSGAGSVAPQALPPVTQASIPITVDPVATEVAPRVEDSAYPIGGIPDAITGRDPTITGGFNVDTNPQAQAAVFIRDQGVAPGPVDLTIDDIGVSVDPTVTGVGGLPGVDPTTLFPQRGTPVPLAEPELLGFGGPGQQAANRAAGQDSLADENLKTLQILEKAKAKLNEGSNQLVTQSEAAANVQDIYRQLEKAGLLEAGGSSGVAPTTAEDAAPTQIDKNGLSRPENVSAAIDLLKTDGKNSASYLQRKLEINYSEAEAINEQLEAEGYVSAKNNLGARKILTTEPTTATVNAATDARTAARALAEGAARVEGTGIIDTVGTDLEGVSPEAKADLDLIFDGKPSRSAGAMGAQNSALAQALAKRGLAAPYESIDTASNEALASNLLAADQDQGTINRIRGQSNFNAVDPDAIQIIQTPEGVKLVDGSGNIISDDVLLSELATTQAEVDALKLNTARGAAEQGIAQVAINKAKAEKSVALTRKMNKIIEALQATTSVTPTLVPLGLDPSGARADLSALTYDNVVDELPPLVSVPAATSPTRREAKTPVVSPIERGIAAATLPAQQQDAPETVTSVDQIQPPMTLDEMNAKEALRLEGIAYLNSIVGKGGKEPTTSPPVSSKLEDMFSEDIDLPPVVSEAKSPVAPVDSLVSEDIDIDALLAESKKGIGTLPFAPAVTTTAGKGTYDPFGDFIAEEVNPSDYIPVAQPNPLNLNIPFNDPKANTDAPTDAPPVTEKDKSGGITEAIPAKTTDSDTETAIEDARKKARLASLKALSTRVAPLKVNAPPGPEDDDRPVPQPAPAITREDDGDTTGGTGTGTGTGVDTVPEQVPVDMTDNDNDDQGCPDGYVRVMVNGAFVCQLIEPEVAVVAAKKKKEKEEPRVVVRPTISPRYRPEAIESNYTPYIPGLGR